MDPRSVKAQCPEEDDPIEQDWSDLQAALEAGVVQARI